MPLPFGRRAKRWSAKHSHERYLRRQTRLPYAGESAGPTPVPFGDVVSGQSAGTKSMKCASSLLIRSHLQLVAQIFMLHHRAPQLPAKRNQLRQKRPRLLRIPPPPQQLPLLASLATPAAISHHSSACVSPSSSFGPPSNTGFVFKKSRTSLFPTNRNPCTHHTAPKRALRGDARAFVHYEGNINERIIAKSLREGGWHPFVTVVP